MVTRKRFNLAIVFGIIASSLLLLSSIVSLAMTVSVDAFVNIFNTLLNDEVFGVFINSMITPETPISVVTTIFYIIILIFNILSFIMAVPSLVFAILNIKEKDLSVEDFQKNNKKHIGLLITLGIGYLGNSYSVISLLNDSLSILSSASNVLFIVAFVFALLEIINNKKALNKNDKVVDVVDNVDVNNNYENVKVNENGNVILEKNNSNVEVKEVKDEKEVKVDNEKLNQVYELLSKLEKSYKNGEVSEEDYNRMKQTILDNYLNK